MKQLGGRLTNILIFALSMSFMGSCTLGHSNDSNTAVNNHKVEKTMKKPAMAHNVYFWLKEGTTDKQKKEFEEGLRKLGTVPSLMSFYWGAPAPTEDRDVIDNSYDYSINSLFLSLEDQEKYQNDPIHLVFIENHKDIWASVKVYDNMTN